MSAKPWFGCDTSGPAWKAYCEAWSLIYVRTPADALGRMERARGKAGREALEHNMRVVKADYAGEIEDRTEIPKRLRL